MKATYWDEHGNRLTVGKCIGSGGEAEICELADDPRRVVKLYHSDLLHPSHGGVDAKLRAMISVASDQLRAAAAWPEAIVLKDRGGPICGFVMPYAAGREIHDLYQPRARAKHFPDKDWKFLVGVGRNLAAALETLHQHDVIVGDFNQRNVRVTRDGFVRFVDCDSFQLRVNGAIYRAAGVGVDEYTPPELQGHDLRTVSFVPQYDGFALAVIIFQLLFLGRHPFFSATSGAAEPPSVGNMIRSGNCLLAQSEEAVPPPGSHGIPREMVSLFIGAFVGSQAEDRPTASQWRIALEALRRQIRSCDSDSGHVFFRGLINCPWCEFASRQRGAYDPFASVGIQRWLSASVETFAQQARELRERIERLVRPLPAAHVPKITTTSRPLPRDVEAAFLRLKTASARRIIPLIREAQAVRHEVERRRQTLELAHQQMESFCSEHERLRLRADIAAKGCWTDAEAMLGRLSELPKAFRRELAAQRSRSGEAELQQFLQSQLIADARRDLRLTREAVSGLEYAGITTAADINEEQGRYYWNTYQGRRFRVKVKGVGPKRWESLLSWRRGLRASFRPTGKLPDALLAALKKKAVVEGTRGGAEIASLIERRETVRRRFEDQLADLQEKIEYAAANIAEAEADWAYIAGLAGI